MKYCSEVNKRKIEMPLLGLTTLGITGNLDKRNFKGRVKAELN